MTQAIKNCSRCNKNLPITDFNVSKKAVDGLQSICRNCHIIYKSTYEKTLNSMSTQRYSSMKWHHGNKEKARVHKLVRKALDSGDLITEPCEICNSLKVEAHHEDYSKPLDVTWLCRTHHRERHMEINKYYSSNPQLLLI